VRVFRNDQITVEQVAELKPSHIIISPGPCTPREAGVSNEVLRRFAPRCRSSACAWAISASVTFSAARWCATPHHARQDFPIHHDNQGVFHGLSNPVRGDALSQPRHSPRDVSQSRFRHQRLDRRGRDHGRAASTWPLHGVQFHPESFLTVEGPRLLKNYLEMTAG
jgi:anthranilate/para-aminobenzoate synthase component II